MHDMFEYEGGIVWNSMVSFVSRGGQETLHDHRSLFYKNTVGRTLVTLHFRRPSSGFKQPEELKRP